MAFFYKCETSYRELSHVLKTSERTKGVKYAIFHPKHDETGEPIYLLSNVDLYPAGSIFSGLMVAQTQEEYDDFVANNQGLYYCETTYLELMVDGFDKPSPKQGNLN